MQAPSLSSKTIIIHNVMAFILLLTISFQGLLINVRMEGVPLWIINLLLFIPFIPRYFKLIIQLSWQLKLTYALLFLTCILISIVALFINEEINDYRFLLVPFLGIYIATILLYNYRDNIYLFIKHIAIIITIMAFFSVMQFLFDFNFFDFFRRKEEYYYESGNFCSTCKFILVDRDEGSSGGFGYPVPYGYYLAFFSPIIYAYFIFYFPKDSSLVRKILFYFVPILAYLSLLSSMQKGAILLVIVSVLVVNLFAIKFKQALILFVLLVLSSNILFNSLQDLKGIEKGNPDMYYLTADPIYKGALGRKELFDLRAMDSRLSSVFAWYKAWKKIDNEPISADYNRDRLTHEVFSSAVLDIRQTKNKYSYVMSLQVPPSPHSYFLNIVMSYGYTVLFSVLFSYFFIVVLIGRITMLNDHKLQYIHVAYLMAIVSYLGVAFIHNNGHFLLDSVGWIGIGLLFVLIYNSFPEGYSDNKVDNNN